MNMMATANGDSTRQRQIAHAKNAMVEAILRGARVVVIGWAGRNDDDLTRHMKKIGYVDFCEGDDASKVRAGSYVVFTRFSSHAVLDQVAGITKHFTKLPISTGALRSQLSVLEALVNVAREKQRLADRERDKNGVTTNVMSIKAAPPPPPPAPVEDSVPEQMIAPTALKPIQNLALAYKKYVDGDWTRVVSSVVIGELWRTHCGEGWLANASQHPDLFTPTHKGARSCIATEKLQRIADEISTVAIPTDPIEKAKHLVANLPAYEKDLDECHLRIEEITGKIEAAKRAKVLLEQLSAI